MALAVRIAHGWGDGVLQTVIDNMESSTWSLLWTFLCNGPKTDASAEWKSWLNGPESFGKRTLLSVGAKHEIEQSWKSFDPIPPSILPFLKFFSKIFSLGEKYSDLLTGLLLKSTNNPQFDEKTDREVANLTRQAFIDYLMVYFDDKNLKLMTDGWPDVNGDGKDVKLWGPIPDPC